MTSILAFFVLICVLVAVHEYGHFWAARRCGVRVLRFSIGFGKVLYKRVDKHGTEWVFSLIPLGGYVKMLNDEPQGKASERYDNKPVWQRMAIILAGPFANFLFAILVYWVVFMVGMPTLKPVIGAVIPNTIAAQAHLPNEFEIKRVAGRTVQNWEETVLALIGQVGSKEVDVSGHLIDETGDQTFTLDLSTWRVDGANSNPLTDLGIQPKRAEPEPTLRTVRKDSAAEKAGLKVGDKILTFNQNPFDWQRLVETIETGEPIEFKLAREDKVLFVQVTPEKSEKSGDYVLGIAPNYQPLGEKYRTESKYDILTAFGKGVEKVGGLIVTIVQFIGNLITGDLSLKNMGGPISMAKGAGLSAEIGLIYYLGFVALISVNLGVMNLFPILPLDGGQFVLLSLEAIRKKRLSEKFQMRVQQLGMGLVICLMVYALVNDLIHF